MSSNQPVISSKSPITPAGKTDSLGSARERTVKLLPTDDYVCVDPETPLQIAIERMKQDQGACAIICDGKKVVGIFTERDVLTKIIGQKVDLNSPIRNWMSTEVVSLSPEATIRDAVEVMNDRGYRNIPLLDGGDLVGAISVLAIISFLAESYPKETMNLPPTAGQVMDTQEGG